MSIISHMTSLCDQELTCLCQCCDHQQSFSHFIYFVCAGLLIWKLKQQRQKDRQGTGLPQSDRSPSTCGHSVFCLMYQQEAGFEVEQLELEPGVQHGRPTLKAGADSEHTTLTLESFVSIFSLMIIGYFNGHCGLVFIHFLVLDNSCPSFCIAHWTQLITESLLEHHISIILNSLYF